MLKRLGFTAAKVVQRMVTDESVIAVSGGSTMAAMADEILVVCCIPWLYQPVVVLVKSSNIKRM